MRQPPQSIFVACALVAGCQTQHTTISNELWCLVWSYVFTCPSWLPPGPCVWGPPGEALSRPTHTFSCPALTRKTSFANSFAYPMESQSCVGVYCARIGNYFYAVLCCSRLTVRLSTAALVFLSCSYCVSFFALTLISCSYCVFLPLLYYVILMLWLSHSLLLLALSTLTETKGSLRTSLRNTAMEDSSRSCSGCRSSK